MTVSVVHGGQGCRLWCILGRVFQKHDPVLVLALTWHIDFETTYMVVRTAICKNYMLLKEKERKYYACGNICL